MGTRLLPNILKGKIVFIGVGNVLRGDDGFGPRMIERLIQETPHVCFDAATAPENYAGRIIKEKPDTVVILDAAHLGLDPGSWQVLTADEIASSGLTTHDLSPDMFIGFLTSQCAARIYMLAVQPETVSFGEEMSRAVWNVIEQLVNIIKEETCTRRT
ncbi:MAG: hydrogenase maturation protease [Candidatus Omnitrophica bacterium]|nr:hydrogenase maturation protease [Candidatus Omnitrophota bacterium]